MTAAKAASASASVLVALPVLLAGGTEFQVLGLVGALRRRGRRVVVCVCFEHDERMAGRFRAAGAELLLLGLDRERHGRGALGLLRLALLLRAQFRGVRPGIVHVQYLAPGLVPVIAARLAGAPRVLATVHIAGREAYGAKAVLLLRAAALLCERFVCVSRGVERFWFGQEHLLAPGERPVSRSVTVYNGVDVDAVRRVVDEVPCDQAKKRWGCAGKETIGVVGRLAGQKGIDTLLRALPAVLERRPDALLLIAGDGPDRVSLERLAAELGVAQSVLWLGALEQERVFELLAALDLFAFPSRFEGFGLAVVEAMAAGLPVVATRVAGVSEIVADGETGFLTAPGDERAIAGRIVELLASPQLRRRQGEAGRARAAACFSIARFEACMRGVYEG